MGRQYTPLVRTPMKNLPSKRASRDSLAREQTCQFRVMASAKSMIINRKPASWTFSDQAPGSTDSGSDGREQQPQTSSPPGNDVRKRPIVSNPMVYLGLRNSMPYIRHCVECPKCLTRYLVAFSPYRNGSCLIPAAAGSSEEYLLYCSCGRPLASSRWNWNQVKTYAVSKSAHHRGYGTPAEIVQLTGGHGMRSGSERQDH